ncbi:MAG TPA: S1C family serine protease [Candidatus Dormibacteraeota bacterium]|nr:S1C family serine protease [Candidatus Dormibacteraeota bacterium]
MGGTGSPSTARPTPLLAAVVLAACVGLVGGGASAWALYQKLGPAVQILSPQQQPGNGKANPATATYASLAAATAPSVVRIVTRPGVAAADLVTGGGSGLATGFTVGSDGLVLTTVHAVAGATALEVAFADGSVDQASVAARDTVHGLVLLRPRLAQGASPPQGLTFANFDSSAPRPGDLAVAVGLRPLSGVSVTVGTVSAVGRTVAPASPADSPVIATLTVDATADPEDDGAPLLDSSGHVIGVVASFDSGAPPGVTALDGRSASALASAGVSPGVRPSMGLSAVILDAQDAAAIHGRAGALVVTVDAGGPAGAAGLHPGDIVTSIDGAQVDAGHPPDAVALGLATGQHVRLGVLRGGQAVEVDLTVG